jgi:hypothetical protein
LSTPYPRTGSYKYNYHMITTTTAPWLAWNKGKDLM